MTVPKLLREEKVGKLRLRLLHHDGKCIGVVVGSDVKVEGDDPAIVWNALLHRAGEGNPEYIGHAGARRRFLDFFSEGFEDPRFIEEERAYKVAASEALRETLPLDRGLSGCGNGEAALAVFRKTNMLSPFEKTRLQEALRGDRADEFVQGAARFASGALASGLAQMQQALAPDDIAKWTAVTYLPFFWKPDEHAFLKPEVMRRFAERIGHPYAYIYSAELRVETYEALLDLHREATTEVADLKPRDNIDIQSYIYVIGEYTDRDKA